MVNVPSELEMQQHLRLVGAVIERLPEYRHPNLGCARDTCLRILAAAPEKSATRQEIKQVLSVDGIPLFNDDVLGTALRSLQNDETIGHDPKTRKYNLLKEFQIEENQLLAQIQAAWERHFAGTPESTRDDFEKVLTVLFAKFGCSAYASLAQSSGDVVPHIRVLVETLFLNQGDSYVADLLEGIESFINSTNPLDTSLKLKLAQAYLVLRMNGAGNWDRTDLSAVLNGKTLLIDTNVLFCAFEEEQTQYLRLFEALKGLGITILVGEESLSEMDTALTRQCEIVQGFLRNGVDVAELVNGGLIRIEWTRGFTGRFPCPKEDDVSCYCSELTDAARKWVSELGLQATHLDQFGETPARAEKVKALRQASFSARKVEKKSTPATHDAILWEACEGEGRLADHVITFDRSLIRIEVEHRRLGLIFDEVVAMMLLGPMSEDDLAKLFSASLKHDLMGTGDHLKLEDVETIATLEARILGLPRRQLKTLMARIRDYRVRCAVDGKDPDPSEISRIVMTFAVRFGETERALVAERHRTDELTSQLKNLGDIQGDNQKLQRQLDEVVRRLGAQDQRVSELTSGISATRTDLAVEKRLREEADSAKQGLTEQSKNRRDWLLFAALSLSAGVVLAVVLDLLAAIPFFALSLLVVSWVALAQEIRPIGLVLLSTLAAVGTFVTVVIAKWGDIRSFLDQLVSRLSS